MQLCLMGGADMIIYVIVALCFIVDLINPKILWHIDFWKYDGDKTEPSSTYMLVHRVVCGIGLIVLAGVFFTQGM